MIFFFWIKNDRVYDSIIRGDWYLMPCEDQMKYQFLMRYAQNAKALTVGDVVPLNMYTCVSVKKTNVRLYFSKIHNVFSDRFSKRFTPTQCGFTNSSHESREPHWSTYDAESEEVVLEKIPFANHPQSNHTLAVEHIFVMLYTCLFCSSNYHMSRMVNKIAFPRENHHVFYSRIVLEAQAWFLTTSFLLKYEGNMLTFSWTMTKNLWIEISSYPLVNGIQMAATKGIRHMFAAIGTMTTSLIRAFSTPSNNNKSITLFMSLQKLTGFV